MVGKTHTQQLDEIQQIYTVEATAPHGHYSQAVIHNNIIYISGLLGNSKEEHIDAARDVVTQAENCLNDLEAILKSCNASLKDMLKLNIYVADVSDWPAVNDLCARRFGAHKPARAVIPALKMRYGSDIEIDGVARVR